VAGDPNPLENILRFHAEKFRDAPGAARVARLAKSARSIPGPLLDDLATLIAQLDDVQLVGNDMAIHLIEVGFCEARYADAVEFASALRSRLRRYVRLPEVAEAAREDFRERIGWWKMVLGRACELRKWPAVVLTEKPSMADNQDDLRHEGSSGDRRM
jgi:hypothetical protein